MTGPVVSAQAFLHHWLDNKAKVGQEIAPPLTCKIAEICDWSCDSLLIAFGMKACLFLYMFFSSSFSDSAKAWRW
jgi:hypothetical protein